MKLYVWSSELLENYRCGVIVVAAKSVDDARRIAREHLPKMLAQRGYDNDGDYTESKRQLFESDIAIEPTVLPGNCFWDTGSE